MTLAGSCHCGHLKVRFETAIAPEQMPVRLCQCTFCRRHGARAATDPAGHLAIEVGEPASVSRYRFGLATADFLICARCGVFVAAVMEVDGAWYATVNVNVLDQRERFAAGEPVSYDVEDAASRIERRKARWTKATVVGL